MIYIYCYLLDTEKDLERNLSTLIVNSAFTHHTYGHSLIEDNLVINESGSVVVRSYLISKVESKSLLMMMSLMHSKTGKTTTFLRTRDHARRCLI